MKTLSKAIIALAVMTVLITAVVLGSGILRSPSSGDRINTVVTIVPQQEIVEAIGGEHVSVTLMVPAGQDPHTYEPTPGQIMAVSQADIYFKVGSGVEFELTKMSTLTEVNPNMAIIDCSKNIPLLDLGGQHADGAEAVEEHAHDGRDPHIWLSPLNLKQMGKNIFDGLVAADPDHSEDYAENLQAYEERMDSLHEIISTELSDYRGMEFMAYHPAWEYFAHEYGLTQIAIEQEGQEPGPKGIEAIIDQARERNIHVVFVSPQIDSSSAKVIADEINGEVVVTDPLPTNIEKELWSLTEEMAMGFSKQG